MERPEDRVLAANFHGPEALNDQRGRDALVAIGYSIQQPRPRHPAAASQQDRAAFKKSSRALLRRRDASIRA